MEQCLSDDSNDESYFIYNKTRFRNDEDKKDFVVLFDYACVNDKLFADIIEGYKIPYSYETIEDDDDVHYSEYTFPIDVYDLIRVIIDMRYLNPIKII